MGCFSDCGREFLSGLCGHGWFGHGWFNQGMRQCRSAATAVPDCNPKCARPPGRPETATHLLAILVKVVEPEDMSTWRIRFSNALSPSSSTRRKACGGAGRAQWCVLCVCVCDVRHVIVSTWHPGTAFLGAASAVRRSGPCLPASVPDPPHPPTCPRPPTPVLKPPPPLPPTHLRRALLGGLVLQAPHAVLVRKALRHHADLGQDAHLRGGGGRGAAASSMLIALTANESAACSTRGRPPLQAHGQAMLVCQHCHRLSSHYMRQSRALSAGPAAHGPAYSAPRSRPC